ncbi:uncharacterized protein LTR77_009027 [Saxophila tyrrhenica]|uniref:Uncharacterized protein n=1 Tax=Saxophila tyrrhenica TaxID=1690608 RepID=A0AAV9P1C9_9PEZI|nr:hypothetical protein LTR77_009027 [Saxophila tyrrhenica]
MAAPFARRCFAKLFQRKTRGARQATGLTAEKVATRPVEASVGIRRSVSTIDLRDFLTSREVRPSQLRRVSRPERSAPLPEHRVATKNRFQLDQAVPRELQQSQTSTDLQHVSRSDEAGCLPFCEDVAQRNLNSQRFKPLELKSQAVQPGPRTSSLNQGSPSPSKHVVSRHAADQSAIMSDQREAIYSGLHHLGSLHSPAKPARIQPQTSPYEPIGEVFLPPLRQDGRRRSLSHKANIADLRVASGAPPPGDVWPSLRLPRPVSEPFSFCPHSGVRLDKPLRPTPVEHIRQDSVLSAPPAGRQENHLPNDSLEYSVYAEARRWSAPQFTESTTWSEQWRPAVTHETIRQDVHEIREERIQKEIHQYHIHRKIQPIIDYEILPARHIVHLEGGGYAEVAQGDLPAGTPDAEWFTKEVRSQLESGLRMSSNSELVSMSRDTSCDETSASEQAAPFRRESWARSTTMKPAVWSDSSGYRYAFKFDGYDEASGPGNVLFHGDQPSPL